METKNTDLIIKGELFKPLEADLSFESLKDIEIVYCLGISLLETRTFTYSYN